MKMTEMIHKIVLAFGPREHPVYALMALAFMLATVVAIVAIIGLGAGETAKTIGSLKALSNLRL